MKPHAPARQRRSVRRVFAIPLLLAVLSAIGLLSALLGDNFWDALSWLGLGVPVAVILWFVARPEREPR
ncbi:MAG TPA: hypothetical protein VFE11_17155 [Dongiaceae bacterium]|jgi:hypothetical protein|nr:hypothetical protein [Dongiaceae bacterium]